MIQVSGLGSVRGAEGGIPWSNFIRPNSKTKLQISKTNLKFKNQNYGKLESHREVAFLVKEVKLPKTLRLHCF